MLDFFYLCLNAIYDFLWWVAMITILVVVLIILGILSLIGAYSLEEGKWK